MDALQNQNLTKKERRELKRQEKLARRGEAARGQVLQRVGLWAGVLGVLALIVFGLVKLGGGGVNTTSPGGVPTPVAGSDWVTGNRLAAATLIEYSDFECPACAAAEPTVKKLREEYGSRIRLVYRHFPLMQHPVSKPAAYAAEAAGNQGKFWEMHDLLFARQREWAGDKGGISAEEKFEDYAKEIGLDEVKYRADFMSDEIRSKVNDQLNEGTRAGVDSTPSFYLNGRKLQLANFNDLLNQVKAAFPSAQ